MKTFALLLASALFCTWPAFAQPNVKPANGLLYPLVSPQEAAHLGETKQLIDLHLRDVTLRQALDELQKQSGVTLDTSRGGDEATLSKHLSLDLKTHSLREACAAILDEADVKGRLEGRNKSGDLKVLFGLEMPQELSVAPQSGLPAFQIHALSLHSSSSKDVSLWKTPSREEESSLNVALRYDVDPQLSVIGSPHWRVTRAEDEKGCSLRGDQSKSGLSEFGFSASSGYDFVMLSGPRSDSRKLAHFDGAAVFVLRTKTQHWEVPDALAAKGATHEFASTQTPLLVTISDARLIGTSLHLNITLEPAQASATLPSLFQSSGSLTQSMRVTDADGHTLGSSGGIVGGKGNKTSAQMDFFLPDTPGSNKTGAQPGPFKLVFDLPTEFVQTEVPFSFSNLPLP